MKILGFILAIVGLVFAALSKFTSFSSKLTFIPKIVLGYSLYIGIVLVVLGVLVLFLSRGSSSGGAQQAAEVPIYEGKRIVGYRRA